MEISFDVENFELVAPGGSAAQAEPGTGHIDLSLNGSVVDMTDQPWVELAVDPGDYQLQAVLVNADHTPILPYCGQTLYFTVDPTRCGS